MDIETVFLSEFKVYKRGLFKQSLTLHPLLSTSEVCQNLGRMASSLMKILAVLTVVLHCCHGHGRMYDPPSRASAWRFGFDTPADYNDNEGFCGGFTHQYETQGGKCGICGDPYEEDPREHEVGGLYATGTITKTYEQGQVATMQLDITANHLGHFEFRICPVTDEKVEVTQECLDAHRLELADGTGVDYVIGSRRGIYDVDYKLPADLTCEHCVVQWRYVAANNWGECEDGSFAIGCGPQEEFRACGDVTIV